MNIKVAAFTVSEKSSNIEAQREHYKELARYDTQEYRVIIMKACQDVDSLVWKWT